MDDILVCGGNEEQHDGRLRHLLDRIRSINPKFNNNKCITRMTEIRYVGLVLTSDGLKPDQGKVRAIHEHARA